mmetsp:Transcript_17743/g.25045  ORF Transcript_17743/g.25045 Transcript_17743/m.25045 type:complete len:835 (-) Transcript_17743:264-2768(-)
MKEPPDSRCCSYGRRNYYFSSQTRHLKSLHDHDCSHSPKPLVKEEEEFDVFRWTLHNRLRLIQLLKKFFFFSLAVSLIFLASNFVRRSSARNRLQPYEVTQNGMDVSMDVHSPLSSSRHDRNTSSSSRHLRVNHGKHQQSELVNFAPLSSDDETSKFATFFTREWCKSTYGLDINPNSNYRIGISSRHRRIQEENSWVKSVPYAVQILLIAILVLFSALFSGLTLGLMGLDTTALEIVMSGDDPIASRAAAKIYPLRSNGNLLLCTLLLGNVAVNTMLGILMADIAGGFVGFAVSTVIIVIFGEIIPQAYLSRHALTAGSKSVPIVKVITIILYPLAKPLAFCLDKVLGHELGTTYSKAEMNKLLEIHVKEGRFTQEVGTAMAGALKYQDMYVKEVMTPLENTFLLNVEERLNFDTIATIFKTGYSRIPVYEDSVSNIIGLLFVKDLIFIDPEDATPVRNFVQIFGRALYVVWPDDKLADVLKYLKKGHSHMALVRDVNNNDETQDPFYEIKGIITLEDIIEIIIGDEIVDETDAWVDAEHSIRVDRVNDFDWARLRLLDAKIVDESLSEEEVRAIAAHLRTNHAEPFTIVSDKQLKRMIAATCVTEYPTATKEIGQILPESLIYKKKTPNDVCTLILSGKMTVLAGSENFRSDISSWSVLASKALIDSKYIPDFSAYVSSGPCRCLCLKREIFAAAVDASALENMPTSEASNNINEKIKDNYQYMPPSAFEIQTTHNEVLLNGKTLLSDAGVTHQRRLKAIAGVDSSTEVKFDENDTSSNPREAFRIRRSKLLHAFFMKKKDEKNQIKEGSVTSEEEKIEIQSTNVTDTEDMH